MRKGDINDFVHSFCFCCRHPEKDWPAVIYNGYRNANEPLPTGARTIPHYVPAGDVGKFLRYLLVHAKSWDKQNDMRRYLYLADALTLFAGGWTEEELKYANEILDKYYATEDCCERST